MSDVTQSDATDAPSEALTMDPASAEAWRGRIAAATRNRQEFLNNNWQTNVGFRVQKPFARTGVGSGDDSPDSDRLSIPEDWSRTKQKTAQLMFYLPKIVAKAAKPEWETIAPTVTEAINKVLRKECKARFMIDECLADVINAAGVMVSMVGIEQTFEQTEVAETVFDPLTQQEIPTGNMTPVSRKVSQSFYWKRLSPANFLWPAEFSGSDWDEAPWLGREFYLTKAQARQRFKTLPKEWDVEESKRPELLSDRVRSHTSKQYGTNYVCVKEIWYKACVYDAAVAHPDCLKRVTFIEGHDDPVEYESPDWQQWVDETPEQPGLPGPDGLAGAPTPAVPGHYKGIRKFPIRVETLTYVSDLAVPPSDSEAGRPQVREMIRSRSQMMRQRDHSIPLRWYDVNRVDDQVITQFRNGVYQDFIPMNGDGSRSIGEVARANYPRENFEFQTVIGRDLDNAWSMSQNQLAAITSTERSATESKLVQNAADTRLYYEKDKVNNYIVGGAEVLFSLMQLFMDQADYVEVVGARGAGVLAQVTPAMIQGDFTLEFVADSSDRVDTQAGFDRVMKMINLFGADPGVNRQALVKEALVFAGMDPAKLLAPPPEPKKEQPNISYRFSGEDMLNPMAVALLVKNDLITPDEIKAAALLIQDAIHQAKTPQAALGDPNAPADAAPVDAGDPNGGPLDAYTEGKVAPIVKRTDNGDRMT